MAKRRAKRSSVKLGTILGFSTLLLAILGVVLFLSLDAVKLYVGDNGISDSAFNGFRVAFGYKETTEALGTTITTVLLNPSTGIIVALALAVIGGVLALPKGKVLNLVGGLALVAAAILFVLAGNLTALTDAMKKLHGALGGIVSICYKSEIGAYLGCAFSGVAGLLAISRAVLNK